MAAGLAVAVGQISRQFSPTWWWQILLTLVLVAAWIVIALGALAYIRYLERLAKRAPDFRKQMKASQLHFVVLVGAVVSIVSWVLYSLMPLAVQVAMIVFGAIWALSVLMAFMALQAGMSEMLIAQARIARRLDTERNDT